MMPRPLPCDQPRATNVRSVMASASDNLVSLTAFLPSKGFLTIVFCI